MSPWKRSKASVPEEALTSTASGQIFSDSTSTSVPRVALISDCDLRTLSFPERQSPRTLCGFRPTESHPYGSATRPSGHGGPERAVRGPRARQERCCSSTGPQLAQRAWGPERRHRPTSAEQPRAARPQPRFGSGESGRAAGLLPP